MGVKESLKKAKDKASEAARTGLNTVGQICLTHGDEIKAGLTLGIPLVVFGVRQHNRNEEKRARECSHYDRRDDEWYESRRKLKSSEKLKLREMYEAGISKGEALKRMHLLK